MTLTLNNRYASLTLGTRKYIALASMLHSLVRGSRTQYNLCSYGHSIDKSTRPL